MRKIKKFYLKSFILSLIFWAFLPIPLSLTTCQIVEEGFYGGCSTSWYLTTMGWEFFTGIYYYILEGFGILLFIVITLIPCFILSTILFKLFYYFYYKKSNKRQVRKKD